MSRNGLGSVPTDRGTPVDPAVMASAPGGRGGPGGTSGSHWHSCSCLFRSHAGITVIPGPPPHRGIGDGGPSSSVPGSPPLAHAGHSLGLETTHAGSMSVLGLNVMSFCVSSA